MTHFSLLGDLINLNTVLQTDRALDLDERKQRDRNIGLELQGYRHKPDAQIHAWLGRIFPKKAMLQGQQAARLYHILCVVLSIVGFIAGWGLASAVLFYDGQQPINIVNALVVLVLAQILLLLLWILTALPFRITLFSSVGSLFGFLNPGRLIAHVTDMFIHKERHGLDVLWHSDNAAIMTSASRWLFSFWSQLFALGFNIGLLMKAFFLVSFSDLAFVWSTTLTIEGDSFHQILSLFSTPWSHLFVDAVPSAELVENSRYYRFDDGSVSEVTTTAQQAIVLGQWWPFLIAAISCYGLLPRLLTLAISWFRFRHHLRQALSHLPGAPELLARMNSPLVSTAADTPEQALNINPEDHAEHELSNNYALRCTVIDWSGACHDQGLVSQHLAKVGIEVAAFHDAGGRRTTAQDGELVASKCADKPDGMVVLAKAWEPPMLEFLDFLRSIRQQCHNNIPIIVLLLADADHVSKPDLDTWQLTLGQLSDPNLHIESTGRLE